MGKIPRGIRNNNPLNIKQTKAYWEGRSEVQNDPDFVQFGSMAYGFRAAFKVFDTYHRKHGVRTLRELIYRWCPDGTAPSYCKTVARMVGIDPESPLSFDDRDVMTAVASAMAFVETGRRVFEHSPWMTPHDVQLGYDMAQ